MVRKHARLALRSSSGSGDNRSEPDMHIDQGESEAIQLARNLRPDFILIDEWLGKREAKRLGLNVIGALGILREAHRLKLLADPLQALGELRDHGFRVSKRLIHEFRIGIEP
jgi:uncharacterized protein